MRHPRSVLVLVRLSVAGAMMVDNSYTPPCLCLRLISEQCYAVNTSPRTRRSRALHGGRVLHCAELCVEHATDVNHVSPASRVRSQAPTTPSPHAPTSQLLRSNREEQTLTTVRPVTEPSNSRQHHVVHATASRYRTVPVHCGRRSSVIQSFESVRVTK